MRQTSCLLSTAYIDIQSPKCSTQHIVSINRFSIPSILSTKSIISIIPPSLLDQLCPLVLSSCILLLFISSKRRRLVRASLRLSEAQNLSTRKIMILHCSCLLSHRHPPSVSQRFQFVPRKFEVLGSSVSLPCNLKKLILSIQDVPCGLFKSLNALQRGSSKYEETKNDQPVADMHNMTINKGMLGVPLAVVTLIWTNVLIFAAPLEALAETCEPDNSFFSMPILLFVALVGATVGGLVARQRKGELQRVNEQLRQINAALRRQAKIESYAPSLSYAPVGSIGRIAESDVVVDLRREELMSHLKTGKNYLRNQDPERAYVEFKAGLEIAQQLNDPIEEKKAARGLGASLQRQGKYADAIKYHSLVLEVSKRQGEDSGNTEAYGAIADCYTELGDLEKAGKFYDQYIARLETD